MTRITLALLGALAIALAAPTALAATGDCNGDGQVDTADIEEMIANNNKPVEGTSLANCDYDGDGVMSVADVGQHISQPD